MEKMLKQKKSRAQVKQEIICWVQSILMLLLVLIVLYPLIYCFFGAFNTNDQYRTSGILPIAIPWDPSTIRNFYVLYTVSDVWVSIFMTFIKFFYYAILGTLISVIAGYFFGKVSFFGKRTLFLYFMISMMIPSISMMVPSYVILVRFPLVGGNNILGSGGNGFLNNPAIFFVNGLFSAYNVFLVKQSMQTIDTAYRESAEMDGAGVLTVIFRIYFPLVKPVVAVMIIGLFLGTWNDYLFSLIYLPDLELFHTIGTKIIEVINTLNMTDISPTPNYPLVFGISLSSMIPPVIVFLVFQKQFVSGLTMGGLKG